jgi:phosphonate transport system substrate-binding protein
MSQKRFFVFSVMAVLLVALVFTSGSEKLIQAQDVPSTLVLAMIPSREPDVLLPDLQPFGDLLAASLQAKGFAVDSVQAVVLESEQATVAGLGTGEIHVGFMGPFSAVQSETEAGARIVTSSVRFGSLFYRGQMMTKSDSGYFNIFDVVNAVQAGEEVTMSYSSSSSTSGFLFPCAMLSQLGALPGDFPNFKTIIAGGHSASALAVFRGDVDLGWGFDDVRQGLVGREADTGISAELPEFEQFEAIDGAMKVIAYSDGIPNDPQVVAGDLPVAFQDAIQASLVELSTTEAGGALLRSLLDGTAFVAVESADFEPVREVVAQVNPNRDRCVNQ